MKRLLSLLLLFSFLVATAQHPPKRELRGAWITTYASLDWPVRTQTGAQQRTALLNILDHHRATGINSVYFQVRSQSDAMYPSPYEPWSYDLTGMQGTNPMWDPLQFALDESHRRGMEFHAWINPYRAVANTANAGNAAHYSAAHISKTHPHWMLTVGTVQILNPGIPEVRDHIVKVIVDILRRYDVDGIHFDDYFYPSGTSGDAAQFSADPRGFTNIADWRRDNINIFIKRVYDSITTIKPWVKFGVSPSGIYRSSTNPAIGSPTSSGALQHYSAYFADTRKWLQEGWLDYLAPQLYWHIGQTGSDYALLVPWWNNNAFNRHIYIGIAAYKVNDPAQGAAWANRSQIPNQVRMNRDHANVYGEIYFRTLHLRNNPLNFRDSLRLHFYNKPALLPTMPWRDNTPPAAPSALSVLKYGNDSVVLAWTKPPATSNELDKARQFVIYRSTSPAIDFSNTNNILAITTNDTSRFRDATIAPNTTYYYAVTALDRFHNESVASNIAANVPPAISCPALQQLVLGNSCSAALPDYRSAAVVNQGMPSTSPITITQVPAAGTVVSQVGNATITLTATDAAGNSSSCTFTVEKLDQTPPVIANASADPAVLTPANHRMRRVNVRYDKWDNCSPVTTVLSVSSNEPENGTGDGDTAPDWEIVDAHTVRLRAERSGNGNGRTYTITITATDASGNSSTQTVTVFVPHNAAQNTVATGAAENETLKEATRLQLTVQPNPSAVAFTVITSSPADTRLQLVVTDASGRVVERRSNLPANGSITLGQRYRAGTYSLQVSQGGEKQTVKLVKK